MGIILIIICIMYIISLYIHIRKNKEKDNIAIKEQVTENLLLNHRDSLSTIINDVIKEEINMDDICSKEELLEILLADISDKFINLLIQEESDKVLSLIDEEIIDNIINTLFISNYDIREIYYKNKYREKENKYDENLGTELVSNSIKSDSSTIDITDDLNGIFFNDID